MSSLSFLPDRLSVALSVRLRPLHRWRRAAVLAGMLCLLGALLAPRVDAQTSEDVLLRASDPGENDYFGRSVAIDGDRAIVGAPSEDGPSGNTSDAGAAYVFERDANGTWQEVQALRASDPGKNDYFGHSVAIDGDRAIVGAPSADGPANNKRNAGAAYVFERTSNGWTQIESRILRASNADEYDEFGRSVAIDAGRAIVGVPFEDGPSDNTSYAGAVYVFERTSSGWDQNENKILRASNTEDNDRFGNSVAISGERVIIGAKYEDGSSNNTRDAGTAYIFERTSSGWTQNEDKILRGSNLNGNENFGVSVAINGDRAIVGAGQAGAGAAYVFERTSSGWSSHEDVILRSSNADPGDRLGHSVAINGDRAIVGAPSEDGPSNNTSSAGAAYIFEHTASGWNENEDVILRSSNSSSLNRFGHSAKISGNRAVVGAQYVDAPSKNKSNAGAAYVYNDLTSPSARADRARGVVGSSAAILVLENDGPGLGTLDNSSVQVETNPSDGTASANADGTITYTPNDGFTGEDSFAYTVANENGNRSTQATVTVTVLPGGYGAGQAVKLDGTGDYVGLPNDAAINTGGPYETRTIELWFKASDVSPSTEQVLFEEGGGGNGFNLYVKSGALYAGAWSEGNGWSGTWLSTSSVQSGTWHHVALVFDNPDGILRAYLDGERFGDDTPGSQMRSHGGNVAIGASRGGTKFSGAGDYGSTGRYFNGRVDQVRLWDGALSAGQVQARTKRTIDLDKPVADSLIAAYRFDSGSGTTVPDYSTSDGTAQDGSFSGDPDRADYSGAPLGDVSTALTGGGATVGAAGGTVTVENVSTSDPDALQVYRYGENDGALIDAGEPQETFSNVGANRRLHVVWGLDAVGPSPSADVTFDFSGISGVNDPNNVTLLKRDGPGDAWTDVTGDWTLDASAQTFSKSNVSSFSQYTVGGTAQSLPVELVAFEAHHTEDGVSVRWRTGSEQNNAGFQVQRRATGPSQAGWATIGHRDGAGTTDQPQRYRFSDTDLPYGADSLSYRLKQVDTDGTVHVSDPISVERGGVQRVELKKTYPNPASGQVTVRFAVPETAEGDTRLTLYDVLGRKVRTVTTEDVEGRVRRQLDVSGLSSGTYVLRLQGGGTVKTRRVTVVR